MAETSAGRKVFKDASGENYSEKTITFETEHGWINIPTVDAEGNQMTQEQLEDFVAENGPIDPVTGKELSTYEDVQSAEAAAQEQTDALGGEMDVMGFNCGGMYDAMVGVDAVSGNPVPPGSSAQNVRDDIPAVLSDGEYVVPADVVRYHGLKTFMALRDEAKDGLMAMFAEGQIQMLDQEGYLEEDDEMEEDTVHETAEGNEVEAAEHIVEEELMDLGEEEEDDEVYASTPGQFAYAPTVRFAVIKK